ncbi:hypothetical protein [Rhizobium rhizogenes]|uniref:hypothetical protein n=1 Tax=Rhizobium rhizogenes TaxID=359 RepID=UPI0022C63797|nr:hypothetical protein [Rhizobium rhizogenes]MCZ7455202.1 hypothetical protein [Rhizobium rhizogenes]
MHFKSFTSRVSFASLIAISSVLVDASSPAFAGHGGHHGIETRAGSYSGSTNRSSASSGSAATGALIGLGVGLLLQGLASAPSTRSETSETQKSGVDLDRESRERWRRKMEAKKKKDEKPYADASRCVTFDPRGFIVNNCNVPIVVRWKDSGSCKTGCMSGAPAGGRSSITRIKGSASYTACQGAYCSPQKN